MNRGVINSNSAALARQQVARHPLQVMNNERLGDNTQSVLQAAVEAEKTCGLLYQNLTQRLRVLANEVLEVQFAWRLRVGGIRGFQECLLPALHPVYGVPYIPSSSLKGVVKAWAKNNSICSEQEVNRLLGTLEDGIGCVQILDAFPTQPCLSVDMANPQWHWQSNGDVKFNPEPHALLSLDKAKIIIGLAKTLRGTLNDVKTVKKWLEQALAQQGLGSRVSSGYGRTHLTNNFSYSSSHSFECWTAGMYGAFPPTREDRMGTPEFRPTAVRGMLRYWFRAVALGIYPPEQCKTLEAKLFGTIEPSANQGSIRIAVHIDNNQNLGNRNWPHYYPGNILLEAREENHLILIQRLLYLASHLGGIGRGARKPLHWNEPYPGLRGCHWELSTPIYPAQPKAWKGIQEVRKAFLNIECPQEEPSDGNPGYPDARCQDVINYNTRIYLIPCKELTHPDEVNQWQQEGQELKVRGVALKLLYNPRFKGVNPQGEGNAKVGGKISKQEQIPPTPSFILIKSNFPENGTPYQAVTVFGSDDPERRKFIKELKALGPQPICVWGKPKPQKEQKQ